MRKTSIPCYVKNGGVHEVVNIPLGQFTRHQLKKLCRELLKSAKTLETFVAAKATPKTINVLEGLLAILDLNLKPKTAREAANNLTTAYEENLKQDKRELGQQQTVNLVDFSIKCGLIVFCYLMSAMLAYFEQTN